jgi:hypothetical protein
VDLGRANLRWADLRGANLQDANLQEADLGEANLQEANLFEADLRGADLTSADLTQAHRESFDADIGKDSAHEIREYFIPDFSDWKNHDHYQKAFERLLKDLHAKDQ